MAIKISELSVGDWVRCGEDTTPYKIIGIDSNVHPNVTLCDSYYPQGVIAFLDMIRPIPITAEILEANGLCVVEQDADFCEYELFGSENFSLFHTKGTLRYRLETPQASVVCWFVHELQHALRLAGVDKEINL